MSKESDKKKLTFKRRGDTLRVSLSNYGNVYYSKQVNVRDTKKLQELIVELKSKGVNLPKNGNVQEINQSWL